MMCLLMELTFFLKKPKFNSLLNPLAFMDRYAAKEICHYRSTRWVAQLSNDQVTVESLTYVSTAFLCRHINQLVSQSTYLILYLVSKGLNRISMRLEGMELKYHP